MKTSTRITKLLATATLAAIMLAPPPYEGRNSSLFTRTAFAHTCCTTFTVDNESSVAPGDVRVAADPADYVDINVTGSGNFMGDVCFAPASVTINSQQVSYPNSGTVQLASGAFIAISWSSGNLVILKDSQGWN